MGNDGRLAREFVKIGSEVGKSAGALEGNLTAKPGAAK